MDFLKYGVILLAVIGFYYGSIKGIAWLNFYSMRHFGQYFFTKKIVLALVVADVLMMIGGYWISNKTSMENAVAMCATGGVIALWLCWFNVKRTNLRFGLGITLGALLLLAVVLYFALFIFLFIFGIVAAAKIVSRKDNVVMVNNPWNP